MILQWVKRTHWIGCVAPDEPGTGCSVDARLLEMPSAFKITSDGETHGRDSDLGHSCRMRHPQFHLPFLSSYIRAPLASSPSALGSEWHSGQKRQTYLEIFPTFPHLLFLLEFKFLSLLFLLRWSQNYDPLKRTGSRHTSRSSSFHILSFCSGVGMTPRQKK